MTINVGIIGTGRAATNYALKGLLGCPKARIVALAGRSQEKCVNLASQIPSQPVAYDNWQQLLLHPNLSAVVICTPPALHFAMIRKALEQGLNVLTEKPAVIKKDEANELLKLSESAGKIVLVQQSLRFSPAVYSARALLAKSVLGKLTSIEARFEHRGPIPPWYFNPAISGGGCFLDLGVHLSDAVRFITGDEFVEIVTEDGATYRYCQANFKLARGTTGTLTTSWNYDGMIGEINFIGEKGEMTVTFRPVGEEKVVLEKAGIKELKLKTSPFQNAFAYFIAKVTDGKLGLDDLGISLSNNLGSLIPILNANPHFE